MKRIMRQWLILKLVSRGADLVQSRVATRRCWKLWGAWGQWLPNCNVRMSSAQDYGCRVRSLFGAFVGVLAMIVVAGCAEAPGPVLVPPIASGLQTAKFVPPHPETWTLPNGLTVMYLEDPELPLARGTLYLSKGAFWESLERSGNVESMGAMLRLGGAGRFSADELDRELERLSASVASGFSGEYGTVSFGCLRSELDEVFGIFEDVILAPRFEEQRLELIKAQSLEGIRRRRDDGDTMASITFKRLVYGSNSPFGVVLDSDDVRRLNVQSLRQSYHRFVQPAGAILVITGQVSRDKVAELVDRKLAKWSVQVSGSELVAPKLEVSAQRKVVFIEAPFEQATIILGHLGAERHSPDQFDIQVFNEVFGGGQESELFERVRSQKGLAYDVSGGISPGLIKGIASIQLQTKAESVAAAILESLAVLHDLASAPMSSDLVEQRKLGVLNSFVFANESADLTLRRQALFKLLGYPQNYDDTYSDNISAVTPDTIQKVALSRWRIDDMTVVVVGPRLALTKLREARAKLPGDLAKAPIVEAKFVETPLF